MEKCTRILSSIARVAPQRPGQATRRRQDVAIEGQGPIAVPSIGVVVAVLMWVILSTGCTTLGRDVTADSAAADTLAQFGQWNADLATVKALGAIHAKARQGKWQGRFAWVGQLPDHLRASALGPGGRPIITIAATPDQTQIIEHHRNEVHRYPPKDRTLSRWLGIPMDSIHLLSLLSGRLPVRAHHRLRLHPNDSDTGKTLTITRSRRTVQRIQWVGMPPSFIRVEMISPLGKLQWAGQLTDWVEVDGFRFPGTVIVQDADDNRVRIRQERFWPQAALSQNVFSP